MPRLKSLPLLHPRVVRSQPTSSPYTSSFKHLLPVSKLQHNSKRNPLSRVRVVRVQDRIKWWNIVPGDLVKVVGKAGSSSSAGDSVGDGNELVRTVTKVNKLTNRVYLKTNKKPSGANAEKFAYTDQNVHYSDVRLLIGHHEFPPLEGSNEPRNLPVFALRIGTTAPKWIGRRWHWERFAIATTPRLPNRKPGTKTRISIPWPRFERKEAPEATIYDTEESAVSAVTYSPSPIPLAPPSASTLRTQEDLYLLMLRDELPYDQTIPMELLISRELSNEHSRAKKRERYLAMKQRLEAEKKQFVKEVVKHLTSPVLLPPSPSLSASTQNTITNLTGFGLSRSEAIKEAHFRWTQKVNAERKSELKRRWELRGEKARLERRRERQKKKVERETRRLRDLVLAEAPNQVVPVAQNHDLRV